MMTDEEALRLAERIERYSGDRHLDIDDVIGDAIGLSRFVRERLTPVKVIGVRDEMEHTRPVPFRTGQCWSCTQLVRWGDKFCSQCGKPLRWPATTA